MRPLARALVCLLPLTSLGIQVRSSTVSGELVSAAAIVPSGELVADVFVVPDGSGFALTQACAEVMFEFVAINPAFVRPEALVIGSVLGTVPLTPGCRRFHPGVVLRGGEAVQCRLTHGSSFEVPCLLTGVLSSDERLGPDVRGSAVRGRLVSASAIVPGGETVAPVFEVPESRQFVLTQACFEIGTSAFIVLPGDTAGRVIGAELGVVPMDFGQRCTSFEPGVAFQSGESIDCGLTKASSSDVACMITGVLTR